MESLLMNGLGIGKIKMDNLIQINDWREQFISQQLDRILGSLNRINTFMKEPENQTDD